MKRSHSVLNTRVFSRLFFVSFPAFSSEVTTNECQEVVVNLVRAFERALDCHSKVNLISSSVNKVSFCFLL